MWYDVNATLSHNCLLNFVVGQRGVGKTYACKKRAIDNFLKKDEQFVYLRRYETELEATNMEKFFEDIEGAYPDTEFKVKNKKFYINGHVAGFYIPLSKSAQFKSVPFPRVSLIIFDEFIIDTGLIRYLPNEVISFNELYSTIARLRDVRVLFLSNAITFTNPYFLFFNLHLQKGQTIVKKGDILLELVANEGYKDKAENTRFGKIMAETEYGNYAFRNEFLRDTDTFIEKMSEPGICIFNLRVHNENFGVYRIIGSEFWYIAEGVDKTLNRTISIDIDSHDQTSIYSKENGGSVWIDELKQKYFRAELRFTTMKSKNLVSTILKRMR